MSLVSGSSCLKNQGRLAREQQSVFIRTTFTILHKLFTLCLWFLDHVLSCPKGGLPLLCHNDVRDLTASLLTEVCSQVIVEPELQPVSNPDKFSLATSNIQESACLDIAMNGFWGGQSERCFVDVRVFNPYTASNKCSSLSATDKKFENIKRHAYSQWIRVVEHASFMPLVMSATGGLAHEATMFYKCLTSLYLLSGEIVMPSH